MAAVSRSVALLLGDPVAQSLSPALHNAAFSALAIDCCYAARQVTRAQLGSVIEEIRADDRILGANVTIPHKESVITLLDDLDPLAGRVGAVNTISRSGALLKGWNTDIEGFRRALEESGYDPAGTRVAVIGAGGAARAVVAALRQSASMVWVLARNLGQAERLCHDLGVDGGKAVSLDRMETIIAEADLIVNATPADLPPKSWLQPEQRVFDLRYRRSLDGLAMLLHQGAAAVEIWTGRPAPLELMRSALERAAGVVHA